MLYQGRYPKYLHHKYTSGSIFFLDRRGYYCYWSYNTLEKRHELFDWIEKEWFMAAYPKVDISAEPFKPEHLLRIDCHITSQMPIIRAYLEDLLEEMGEVKFDI